MTRSHLSCKGTPQGPETSPWTHPEGSTTSSGATLGTQPFTHMQTFGESNHSTQAMYKNLLHPGTSTAHGERFPNLSQSQVTAPAQ